MAFVVLPLSVSVNVRPNSKPSVAAKRPSAALLPKRSGPLKCAPGRARIWGAGAALIPSPFTHPSSVRAVMLRAHPRTLEDRTARPGPLALGDDEPADEVEGSDRALCCSPILFGLLALEVRFRPAGLALLRRELGVARTRVMLRKSRTRLRTRALRVSFLSWAAFRSIDLNGRGLRTSLARVRARIGRKIA